MDSETKLLRSWMFVPGHRQRMIDKALELQTVDAILLDIEDGVAATEKDTARRQIAHSLDALQEKIAAASAPVRTPARYVRINAVGHERMHHDLSTVLRPALEGLLLPKVEKPEQILYVEELLNRREPQMGVELGSIRLLVAIETPRGLLNAYTLATASSRVIGLIFGAEDFGREMGLPLRREAEARDLIYARSAIATAAAAAKVQAVEGVWTNLEDMDGCAKFAQQSRRLGFTGMSLIHPSQVDTVNAAFSPTPEEMDYCRKVVAAYAEGVARGEGAIAFGGQLLDPPIVDRARRTLALAESLGI